MYILKNSEIFSYWNEKFKFVKYFIITITSNISVMELSTHRLIIVNAALFKLRIVFLSNLTNWNANRWTFFSKACFLNWDGIELTGA